MNFIQRDVSNLRHDYAALEEFCRGNSRLVPTVRCSYRWLKRQYFLYALLFETPVPRLRIGPRGFRGSAELVDLYASKAKCLRDLRPTMASDRLGVCPYCGLPGNITVDHYLPKNRSDFPHLSVFSFNLVPACVACQQIKGSFVPKRCLKIERVGRRAPANPRRIVHPYFDAFVAKRAIEIELSVSAAGEPDSFQVRPARHLVGGKRRLIDFHIKKLKICGRHQSPLGGVWRQAVELARGQDVVGLEGALENAARAELAKARVPNAIEGLVLLAMRRTPQVLAALLQAAGTPRPVLTPLPMNTRRRQRRFA